MMKTTVDHLISQLFMSSIRKNTSEFGTVKIKLDQILGKFQAETVCILQEADGNIAPSASVVQR